VAPVAGGQSASERVEHAAEQGQVSVRSLRLGGWVGLAFCGPQATAWMRSGVPDLVGCDPSPLIADATVEEEPPQVPFGLLCCGLVGVVAGICGRLRLEAGVVAGRFGWVGDCLEAVGFVMVFSLLSG